MSVDTRSTTDSSGAAQASIGGAIGPSSAVDLKAVFDIVYFPLGAAAFGGAERSLLELASAQQGKGRRVLVCYEAALDKTDFVREAQARTLMLHRLDWAPEKSVAEVLSAAWKVFSALDAKLVHFNISWRPRMWLVPVLARLLSRARLIGTMRAMPEPFDRIPRRRYLGLIPGPRLWALPDMFRGRVWARTLHETVSVNRNDYPPRLIAEYSFAPDHLKVIYNGVRIPGQAPSEAQRLQGKLALGYPAEAFLVAYMGRVSREKGIFFAVEALAACDPRIHLVIAGEGPELDAIRQQVADMQLTSRVRFLGYVRDPFSVFSAVEAAVVPSLWNEAFGRVVVEAMACGAVVVATAVGGMQELFADGEEGLFVPKADARAIAAALNELVADDGRRRRISEAGRRLAQSRYATERVADEYAALYAHTLQ